MRRKSTIIQFIGGQSLVILSIIQNIFLVPVYLQFVGSEAYGVWVASFGAISLLLVMDMGISGLIIQKLSYVTGQHKDDEVKKLVVHFTQISIFVLILIVLIGMGIKSEIPIWFDISPNLTQDLNAAIMMAIVDISIMWVANISGSMLFAFQKPAAHMLGLTIGTLVSILGTLYFLSCGFGLLGIAMGSSLRSVISALINIIYFRNNFKDYFMGNLFSVNFCELMTIIKELAIIGPAKIAESFFSQVENLVILKLFGGVAVTNVGIKRKAADLSSQVLGRLSVSLLSANANLCGEGDQSKFDKLSIHLLKVVFIILALSVAIGISFNKQFVSLWVGSQYYISLEMSVLFFAFSTLKVLRITFFNLIFASGEYSRSSVSLFAELGVYISLVLTFSGEINLVGLFVVAIFAELFSIALQLYKSKLSSVIKKELSKRRLLKMLAFLANSCVIAYLSANLINPNTFYEFTVAILLTFVLLATLIYLTYKSTLVSIFGIFKG